MADKLSISLKTYQNFENGITKIDLERLNEVAKILEISVDDLINTEDGVYINEIRNNDVGFNNSEITINHQRSEFEKHLYEKIIKDKEDEISFLRDLLKSLGKEKIQ